MPYPILLIRVVLPYSSNTYIRTPCFVYVYTYPILLTRIFLPYSFIHNLSPFKLYADSHILYYTQIRTFVYTYSSQIVKYVHTYPILLIRIYVPYSSYTYILTQFFHSWCITIHIICRFSHPILYTNMCSQILDGEDS